MKKAVCVLLNIVALQYVMAGGESEQPEPDTHRYKEVNDALQADLGALADLEDALAECKATKAQEDAQAELEAKCSSLDCTNAGHKDCAEFATTCERGCADDNDWKIISPECKKSSNVCFGADKDDASKCEVGCADDSVKQADNPSCKKKSARLFSKNIISHQTDLATDCTEQATALEAQNDDSIRGSLAAKIKAVTDVNTGLSAGTKEAVNTAATDGHRLFLLSDVQPNAAMETPEDDGPQVTYKDFKDRLVAQKGLWDKIKVLDEADRDAEGAEQAAKELAGERVKADDLAIATIETLTTVIAQVIAGTSVPADYQSAYATYLTQACEVQIAFEKELIKDPETSEEDKTKLEENEKDNEEEQAGLKEDEEAAAAAAAAADEEGGSGVVLWVCIIGGVLLIGGFLAYWFMCRKTDEKKE